MSGLADVYSLAMLMETTLTKLTTLGIEYETKNLSPERFSRRVLEILSDHQRSLITFDKRSTPQKEQG